MSKHYSIALDGPSSSGKSSLAKRMASALSLVYVDTGAIYRSVGLACYRKGIDMKSEQAVAAVLPELVIDIHYDENGLQHMVLNGEDVTAQIRLPEISLAASDVSAHPVCRAFLLDMQRAFARNYNVIMDGRDIGTVVLPDADLKVFLTASAEARANRRYLELKQKGIESSYEEVLRDIELRDYQDIHRDISPLKQAEDAVLLDTSTLDFDESYQALFDLIAKRLPALTEAKA